MERVNFFIEDATTCFVTYIVSKNNLVIAKVYDENLNLKQTLTTHRQTGESPIEIMVGLYDQIYDTKTEEFDEQIIVDRMYLIEDDEWNFLGLTH